MLYVVQQTKCREYGDPDRSSWASIGFYTDDEQAIEDAESETSDVEYDSDYEYYRRVVEVPENTIVSNFWGLLRGKIDEYDDEIRVIWQDSI